MKTMNIVIVCMSNTCRSPMAEHLCRDKLSKKGLSDQFSVTSRGMTDAYEKPGSPASAQGVEVIIFLICFLFFCNLCVFF